MDTRYQKWVTASYLGAAILAGYIVSGLAARLVGIYDLETRVRNIDLILRVSSVLLGAIAFFILVRHQKANQFMNEVMVELSRVSWPTQKETTSATMIVIIMVVISGVVLGFLDYLWTVLLKWVV